ncbi:hypothetical protein KSP40_PGU002965 [Platanthera guangdongensis]|uniref:Uncharacterized protein n=1 Tax=Platanthera guangdongensis TaxID=2320717 RepID=A0ABR2MQY2_9ASPA
MTGMAKRAWTEQQHGLYLLWLEQRFVEELVGRRRQRRGGEPGFEEAGADHGFGRPATRPKFESPHSSQPADVGLGTGMLTNASN